MLLNALTENNGLHSEVTIDNLYTCIQENKPLFCTKGIQQMFSTIIKRQKLCLMCHKVNALVHVVQLYIIYIGHCSQVLDTQLLESFLGPLRRIGNSG